jgi:hypothetical protein
MEDGPKAMQIVTVRPVEADEKPRARGVSQG